MTEVIFGDGTDVPVIKLRDGYISVTDTGPSSDSNPTGTVVKNSLYAKNIVKGWVKAWGTTSADESFGLTSIAASGNGVRVTWQHTSASAFDSAYAGLSDGASATTATFMTIDNHAVNACTARFWRWNGSAIVEENVASNDWSLVRHARIN